MNGIKSIQMKFCRIDYCSDANQEFVVTHFLDGKKYGALPAITDEYYNLALRCGYRWHGFETGDIWRYCIEHEIAHSLIAEYLYDEPSRVIWGCAHGQYASKLDILHEEELSVSLQAFARAGVLPASSAPGFSWWKLRDRFYALFD